LAARVGKADTRWQLVDDCLQPTLVETPCGLHRHLLTRDVLSGQDDFRGFVEDAEDTGDLPIAVVDRTARQREIGFASGTVVCDREPNIG
jgi:hypothetical protein